ncbi:MAG TPA: MBL fold metallo-hydrolase [Candidatus Cybelea sp.]|nr:MBL fold metallo-hydrolase [Candidatus Cybelea sp.]
MASAAFGVYLDGMHSERPDHHTERGFRNPPGSPVRQSERRAYWRFVWRRILKAQHRPAVPFDHALSANETLAGLAAHARLDSVTWLGHAAFLLRLAGRTILLDPYLGEFASPVPGFGPRRFAKPALRAEHLPPIDTLIVSHNHYDHLCAPTVRALAGKRHMQVVVPLGLARFFRRRGYRHVHELDWHQHVDLEGLRVRALPAVHWSKRTPFDRNRSLWASFALTTPERRVWFAGDTGFGPVFEELGSKYGPFDLALVPIGAYAPRHIMEAHHATPEEALRIAELMGARHVIGMHWGTVVLTDEHPFEPPERFRRAARHSSYGDERAWLLRIGETRPIPERWPANA